MKPLRLIALAAALALASACGSSKCPTESPAVEAMPTSCTAVAGSTVSYPLRLCPTCNQTFSACSVDMQGHTIFLDPTVEACSSSTSCPPSCSPNPATCTFTAPNDAAGAQYTVSVYDAGSGQTKTGTLTIADAASCSLTASL